MLIPIAPPPSSHGLVLCHRCQPPSNRPSRRPGQVPVPGILVRRGTRSVGSGCICSTTAEAEGLFTRLASSPCLCLGSLPDHFPARRCPQVRAGNTRFCPATHPPGKANSFTSRNLGVWTSLPGAESLHASNCDDLMFLLVLPFQRKLARS